MMPGEMNLPVASTTSAPAGIETLAPAAAILPSRSTIVPFGIVPRVTVTSVPPRIATTGAVVRVWASSGPNAPTARQARTKKRFTISPLPRFGRRLGRGLEQILIEPLEVVIHRRAMTLRLGRSVADAAEALIHDQLHRDVLILHSLIQLEG